MMNAILRTARLFHELFIEKYLRDLETMTVCTRRRFEVTTRYEQIEYVFLLYVNNKSNIPIQVTL